MPDPKAVYDEIVAAFRDSHPVPHRCYPEDLGPYDEDAERFDYLIDKTWLDVAGDARDFPLAPAMTMAPATFHMA
jgi:hypothetical protein